MKSVSCEGGGLSKKRERMRKNTRRARKNEKGKE